jgi:hypothetical protein
MRIENVATSGILVLLSSMFMQGGSPQTAAKTIYLLEDAEHQQWCAFSSESGWKSQVNSLSAMRVATVDYVNDHISVVHITEEDETGDWIVYDHYSFDKSGALQKLKRTMNILPGNRSEEQVFLVQDGKTIKQSTISRDLSTGKPTAPSNDWLPDVPIITSVQAFPFSSLIGSKRLEIWSKGKACIHVRADGGT